MTMVPYKLLLATVRCDGDNVVISKLFFDFLLRQILNKSEIDEESYLKFNPDVASSVRKGDWQSAKEHFVSMGYFEDRDGAGKQLAEAWYLRVNPDVASAVKSGEWVSGESHYNERGVFEWRAPNKEAQEVFSLWKQALVAASATKSSVAA